LSLNNVVGAYGGAFFSEDGKRLTIDTPQFMAAMEWAASIWQERLAGDWSGFDVREQFGAGKLAMFHTGYWGQIDGKVLEGARWNCAVQPKGPAGKRGTSLTINGMCLWSSSKQLAAGWDFLKFLFEPEIHLPDVLAGRSRPALKREILYHPKLLEGMKAQKVWADAISAAEPWKMPANYRWAEFSTAVTEVFQPVWQVQKGLREVMPDARQKLQFILDQPVPE
jgi:ABC-type glycerol-3-phosphate transport system substrate-binding protein